MYIKHFVKSVQNSTKKLLTKDVQNGHSYLLRLNYTYKSCNIVPNRFINQCSINQERDSYLVKKASKAKNHHTLPKLTEKIYALRTYG